MWNTINPINPIHGYTWNGIPTARKGEGLAGKGTKRKRMPIYNGLDRVYYIKFIVVDTQLERVLTSKVVETEKAL